jgi:predicted transcriptional regulator
MFGLGKTVSVKIDRDLHARIKKVADVAGYATVEEFIQHILEKEMLHFEDTRNEGDIRAKLKGLGYIS